MNLICAYCGVAFAADRGAGARDPRETSGWRPWWVVAAGVVLASSLAGLVAGLVHLLLRRR
jgi:hypothetical protein